MTQEGTDQPLISISNHNMNINTPHLSTDSHQISQINELSSGSSSMSYPLYSTHSDDQSYDRMGSPLSQKSNSLLLSINPTALDAGNSNTHDFTGANNVTINTATNNHATCTQPTSALNSTAAVILVKPHHPFSESASSSSSSSSSSSVHSHNLTSTSAASHHPQHHSSGNVPFPAYQTSQQSQSPSPSINHQAPYHLQRFGSDTQQHPVLLGSHLAASSIPLRSTPQQNPSPFVLPNHGHHLSQSQMLNQQQPTPAHHQLFGYPRCSPPIYLPPQSHQRSSASFNPHHSSLGDHVDYRLNPTQTTHNPWHNLSINPVPEPYQPAFYDPFQIKHRRRTTPAQLNVLEAQFESNSKPDVVLRKQLAEQLDMTPREVQVWFQNRRAKTKKLEKRAEHEIKSNDQNLDQCEDQLSHNEEMSADPHTSDHPNRLSISPQSSVFFNVSNSAPSSKPDSIISIASAGGSSEDFRQQSTNQSSDYARPSPTSISAGLFSAHKSDSNATTGIGRTQFASNEDQLTNPSDHLLNNERRPSTDRHVGHTSINPPAIYQPVRLYPVTPSFVSGSATAAPVLSPITTSMGDKDSAQPLGHGYDYRPRTSIASSIATSDSHHGQPDSLDNFMTPTTTDFSFDHSSHGGMMGGDNGTLYPVGYDPRRRASCPAEFIQSFGHFGFAPMSPGGVSPVATGQLGGPSAGPMFNGSPISSQSTIWNRTPTQPDWKVDDDTGADETMMASGMKDANLDPINGSSDAPNSGGSGAIQRRHSVASIITYGRSGIPMSNPAVVGHLGSSPQHLSPHSKPNGNPPFPVPAHMMSSYGRRGSTSSSVAVLNAIEEHPGSVGSSESMEERSSTSEVDEGQPDLSSPSNRSQRRPQLERRARSHANMKSASTYQLMKPNKHSMGRRFSVGPPNSLEAMFDLGTHNENEGG